MSLQKTEVEIVPNDREQIKTVLVTLMLSVPGRIQSQISEALSIISSTDFPNKWQTLLPVRSIMFIEPIIYAFIRSSSVRSTPKTLT